MARKKSGLAEETAAKTIKTAAKSAKSTTKTSKSKESPDAKSKSKSPQKTASKATKVPTSSRKRTKTPEIAADSIDSTLSDAAARLEAMELEAAQVADSTPNESLPEIIYSLKSGSQIFVKTADIVAATGKTTSWIRDLTARGIIKETKTKYGALFDIVQTMRAYCATLEARRYDDDTADIELKKKKAEAKLKESKAAIAEMQAKEFQGKMHRSEDVQKMTADLLYFVRGGLVALAGRCANDCAASSEPAVIQKIIEREVREILKDLSEYKYDPKRYDELVRQRTNRELDAGFDDEEDTD